MCDYYNFLGLRNIKIKNGSTVILLSKLKMFYDAIYPTLLGTCCCRLRGIMVVRKINRSNSKKRLGGISCTGGEAQHERSTVDERR